MNREIAKDRYFWSRLKHYVYKLSDPHNHKVFYIGKGVGSRVLDHVESARKTKSLSFKGGMNPKLEKIYEILARGDEPAYSIVCHGLETDGEAKRIEGILIQQFREQLELTNQQAGQHIDEFGETTIQKLYWKYRPTNMSNIAHKAILFKIDKAVDGYHLNVENPDHVLQAVEKAWKISRHRARRSELVLAVYNDVCVGVFKPEEWLAATKANFETMQEDQPDRLGFKGSFIVDSPYLYKTLPAELQWGRGWPRPFKYHPAGGW